MDEELNERGTEEFYIIQEDDIENVSDVVSVSEDEDIEKTMHFTEVKLADTIEIEMSEAVGWAGGDSSKHYSLSGRDDYDQHPIKSITGLRSELDEIERIKVVYSDKIGVANYYEWNSASYDTYGYFVSIVPNTSTIKICDGSDIFGVSVDTAGFIGGQGADASRNDSYGLIATSGVVWVRCESDVEVGNLVVSNAHGCARKSDSNYGYKVLARENKKGVEYAIIMLGVQSDIVDLLGVDLQNIDKRVSINEQNIVSAINVANYAYNKSVESSESSSVSAEAVKEALESILNMEEDVKDLKDGFLSVNSVATQAKGIANDALTSAASMQKDAVEKADASWKGINDLTETLHPIISWKDDATGASGVEYLTTQMDNGIATTYDIKVVDEKTEKSMHAVTRSAKEMRSLMTVIDKYSVGPYSQAYGLTIEQAQSILEPGMIYVPTSHENLEANTKYHEEKYPYTNDENAQIFTRSFAPGYLYQWRKLDSGIYGWITVDKNYNPNINEVDADEKSSINNSAMAVCFSHVEIIVGSQNNYGYWYTNGDEIIDRNGNTGTYEPYTLYKWEKQEGEDGYWFAVATLAGNSSNRATSMVTQNTNAIAAELTNAYGAVAGSGVYMKDTRSKVQSIASWPTTKGVHRLATIEQAASGDDSHLVLAAGTKADGSPKLLSGATIVLDDSKKGSYIQLDADKIDFTAGDFTVDANHINFDADDYTIDASKISLNGNVEFTRKDDDGTTYINGASIMTGTLLANKITTGEIKSQNYSPETSGTKISLMDGTIDTAKFKVGSDGKIIASGGEIAGWNIDEESIYKGNVGLVSSGQSYDSLVSSDVSPMRFYAGGNYGNTYSVHKEFTPTSTNTTHYGITFNLPDGVKNISIINVSATTSSGAECTIDKFQYRINDTTVLISLFVTVATLPDTLNIDVVYEEEIQFRVLEDGSLYASAANINGTVSASAGDIGGLKINNGIKGYVGNKESFSLTQNGLLLNNENAKIQVGNFQTYYDSSSERTYWNAHGPLCIQGIESGEPITAIELMTEDGVKSSICKIYYDMTYIENSPSVYKNTFEFKFYTQDELKHPVTYVVPYRTYYKYYGMREGNEGSFSFTLPPDVKTTTVVLQEDSKMINISIQLPNGQWSEQFTDSVNGCSFSTVTQFETSNNIRIKGNLVPTESGAYSIGRNTDGLWHTIFAITSQISQSDRNKKNTIRPLQDAHEQIFDDLKPVSYKFNDSHSDRTHIGFIAQDVKESVERAGLTTQDFAGYCEWESDDGETGCGLRYAEFISLCVDQIQKLKKRVEELEEKLNKTE